MGKKFGGKFSPQDEHVSDIKVAIKTEAKKRKRKERTSQTKPARSRANWLYLPALIMLFRSIGDGAADMSISLVISAIWALGAYLTKEGIRAEIAFHERQSARRPAIPRKFFAAALSGLGVAWATYYNDGHAVASLLYSVCAIGLHIAAFGIDPMKDKSIEGIDDFQQDRAQKAIAEAEQRLIEMSEAIRTLRDRNLSTRVHSFAETARDMFDRIAADPNDLSAARKYLTVYLEGAKEATLRFCDLYLQSRDEKAKRDYIALLDDLEENFADRTQRLLENDKANLNVEIEVLRERLAEEAKKH